MAKASSVLTVGLKYCGGCNPRYDRVALVAQIRRQLDGRVRWVTADDPAADLILAVHGCPTACADLQECRNKPVVAITDGAAVDAVVHRILI